MKKYISISVLFLVSILNTFAQSVSISKKNSSDPTNVCDEYGYYYYVTTFSDLDPDVTYDVAWDIDNGTIDQQSINEAKVQWVADSDENDGNTGTIKAILKVGDTQIDVSDPINVTIKSIQHLKPTLTPYPGGTEIKISPCSGGSETLEVSRLEIPGTGEYNLDKVYDYEWIIPSGWQMFGQTSNGSDAIQGDYYGTVSYPASATGGTIKVRGYCSVAGCDATIQYSKYSDAVTITRDVEWELTANKSSFLCGDTDPITFTVSPKTSTPNVSCAVFYWNNSTTATTSNTFSISPGNGDLIVTVKIVYGNDDKVLPLTIPSKAFNDGEEPDITGPAVICDEETYSVAGLRPGYTLEWNSSSRALSLKSANGNSAVFEAVRSGYGTISCNVLTQCGHDVPLQVVNIAAGPETPGALVVLDPLTNATVSDFETHKTYRYRIGFYPSTDPNDYHWEVKYEEADGNVLQMLIPPGPTNYLDFSANYPYPVKYTISGAYDNGCGFGNPTTQDYYFFGTGLLSVGINPNPAVGEVTVSLDNEMVSDGFMGINPQENYFDENAEWDLEIYNNTKNLKLKKQKLKGKSTKINTQSWKEGVYMVRVKYKDEILTGKLIVKK